jgi:DNA-binding SARP family transcriptional activator/tetratricopeptide (TPR) repeat protein
MRFEVLGPIRAWHGSAEIAITARREQILLAMLLLRAGRYVPVDPLIEAMWVHSAPRDAATQIHGTVYRLRRRLAAAGLPATVIVTQTGGYRAEVPAARVDLWEFRRLRDEARAAAARGDGQLAAHGYRSALDLWRGPAFSGVDSPPLRDAADALEEERVHALAERIRLDLANGAAGELVAELTELVREHPYREALHSALMLACYRADRQADALAAYRRLRRRMREDLGTEPGAELQRLHRAIIERDPGLSPTPRGTAPPPGTAPPGTAPPPGTPPPVVPRQLPADVSGFAGRGRQLARLDALLSGGATAVMISAIDGTAGVGKTALAVHWAHRVADRFPDGQLYVNLRGFDPGGQMMAPAEAVRGFLDALGVPPQRIPAQLDAQAALYRSLLAGRRMLVLLDNARDAGQVRPLLPGAGGCLALITSRNQLTPLLATTGGHPLTLDLLTPAESWELLAGRLGAQRLAAEARAAQEIVAGCAHLPLALAIAAARAQQTGFSLATIAAELASAGGRLEALDLGDPATRLRGVFSWSYTTLSAPAARLFRLLGLHPGPYVCAPAAASLAALPIPAVRPLLAELARANLLHEHRPGRYSVHDLLRAYATELTHAIDTDADRDAATHRLLDHYLHTAVAAAMLLDPFRQPVEPLDPPAPGVVVQPLADRSEAARWFTAERSALVATVSHLDGSDRDGYAWRLAWALVWFLDSRGHWHDQVTVQAHGAASAGRQDDPLVLARAHRFLGVAHARLRQWDDAERHLRTTLKIYSGMDDPLAQAAAHSSLGAMYELRGDYDGLLQHATEALRLADTTGQRQALARYHNALGWCHALRGEAAAAIDQCERSLALYRQVDDPAGAAKAWDSLGYAHLQLADHGQAATCFERSLEQLDRDDNRQDRADTLHHLGDARHALGDLAAARTAWERALEILVEHASPVADQVRMKLAGLPDP